MASVDEALRSGERVGVAAVDDDGAKARARETLRRVDQNRHLVIAVRPSEARQIVDERLGQVPVVAILENAARAMSLR